MVERSEGRRLNALAGAAREGDRPDEAIQLLDQAIGVFTSDSRERRDHDGLGQARSARAIVRRHQYQKTGERSYLEDGLRNQLSAVQEAEESGEPTALAIPLRELANLQETLGDFSEAVRTYQRAVDSPLPPALDRPAVRADLRVHLTTCEYKAGDKSALARAEAALAELKEAEEQPYEKTVWVSGGYMRLADMLRADDPQKARDSLAQANQTIISTERDHPDLNFSIRKRQIGDLEKTFPPKE